MLSTRVVQRALVGLLVTWATTMEVVRADSAQNTFYRAYYVEQADGDWGLAAGLYEKVVTDRQAGPGLRAEAEARLVACREELVSSDFARLMPPEAWVYVEINRPADQIVELLDKLGLLAQAGRVLGKGEKRVAISPAVIKEALGIRGAAFAITGMDLLKKAPRGVLVFHPGDLDILSGLLETGLAVGGEATEPIGGFPTYLVEGQAFVTLTSRLAVVSTERAQIQGVVDRLSGTEQPSLATNPAMSEIVEGRDDSLLFFFVNAKAMMPMLKGMMAMGAMASRELAMAQAVLDLDSLDSLTGRAGINDDGLYFDFALRLDEGHRNLVFNLLRMPAINFETLKSVPGGVAGVLVVALNEATSRYSSSLPGSSDRPPIVTAMDFGRELFANITSIALFALPPGDSPVRSGLPIPDAAVVITVNDPAKSEALWTQIFGLATFATGIPATQNTSETIDGVTAHKYSLPDGITIYVATSGNDVLIASSKRAIASSLRAQRGGESILNDEAFKASLSRFSEDTTRALLVHAGRSAAIAGRFMSPGEMAEVGPYLKLLSDTSVSVVVDHSGELFRMSGMLTGIPDVGDLVAKMVTDEVRKQESHSRLTRSMRDKNWDEALTLVDTQLREQPDNVKLLRTKFKITAVGQKDRETALACGNLIFDQTKDDAKALNNLAWALLTEDQYGDDYSKLALKLSKRSNELTEHGNWMFVDTLALAKFKTKDVQAAVELEKKAIELCGKCGGRGDLEKVLTRFESTAGENEIAVTAGSE